MPILSSAFLPSAARSRGAARIRTVDSFCRKRTKRVEGMLTIQSAWLSDERKGARMLSSPPETSPEAPVGDSVAEAV